MEIKPWLTAIKRNKISAPMRILLDKNYISKNDTILDYGCGHGFDVSYLSESGFNIEGYDKYIKDNSVSTIDYGKYSSITCFYVLNTIPSIEERVLVVEDIIKALDTSGKAYICVRSLDEYNSLKNKSNLKEYSDGVVTSKRTFQKYFSREDVENFFNDNFSSINISFIPISKSSIFVKVTKNSNLIA